MRFDVICSDPPWKFSSGGIRSGRYSALPYRQMPFKAICSLPVQSVAADDSALFLWFPGSFVEEPAKVCRAWGFRPVRIDKVWKKVYASGKPRAVVGPYGMNDAEFVLMGVRGKVRLMLRRPCNQYTTQTEVVPPGHSVKPQKFRALIERRFIDGVVRLEMFAREKHDGWTCVGDEVDGMDIKHSLEKLVLL